MKSTINQSSLKFYQGVIVGLVLLATWLRLWQLDPVPPGLWFDEAYNGMDAVWMLKTKTWPVFLVGNHGREAMYHYLLALSITILGDTPYAIRLVSALLGILSIPLMYRWGLTLLRGDAYARSIAVVGAAGLTTSLWYLIMNRAGYRANLLPLFILLGTYFFWRGWQTGHKRYYGLAGLGLGLSQYTYLSARLLPLVFLLFVAGQSLFWWKTKDRRSQLKTTWLGLLIMAGVSALVAAPLMLFILNNPSEAWDRSLDVAVKFDWSLTGIGTLGSHLLTAIRVFIDGQDPNWRHHLLDRPGFDWFSTLGFLAGLAIAIRHIKHPPYLFLLILLFVMWLPAPLSRPANHTLRLVGLLPAYYLLMSVGLIKIVAWLLARLPLRITDRQVGLVALSLLLLFSGVLTVYDYFYRWAKLPEVYAAFDSPVVAVADYLSAPDSEINLVIPFYLYSHASVRYLLHDDFREETLMPEDVAAELRRQEKISVIIPDYPEDDGQPPAYVWLKKDKFEPGVAYVSAVRRDITANNLDLERLEMVKGNRDDVIAQQYNLDPQLMLPLFPARMPRKEMSAEWVDNLRLTEYEFVPDSIQAGDTTNLYLAWEILGHTALQQKMFLQLLDSQGHPVGQQELDPISKKMYRWREDGLVLEQHPLNLGSELEAGLYFVRLGFFDPKTGQRLPAYGSEQQPLGDELMLGPLYVTANGLDPIPAQAKMSAMLGDGFELVGYSIRPAEIENSTEVELYWRTRARVDIDYTVFIQLLDPQNQVLAQVDAQPLGELFPTSSWQPGDIISDQFVLPVKFEELMGENRLVTGMYDLSTGLRLPAYNVKGVLFPDNSIQLTVDR